MDVDKPKNPDPTCLNNPDYPHGTPNLLPEVKATD